MKKTYLLMVLLALGFLSGSAGAEPVNLIANGSFEFWTRFSEDFLAREKANLWNPDPLVPVRWGYRIWPGAKIEQSTDAHGGKYSLLAGGGTRFLMVWLEVMPGAEYSYGVRCKGHGKISVSLKGMAIEGDQILSTANGAATDQWQHVGGKLIIPQHIRQVSLTLEVQDGLILLDDAHISAELTQPYDADAVLRDPYKADEHTIFFENFDGKENRFKTEYPNLIHPTDEKGGRFGHGLRLDPISSASFPLDMKEMPEEGTIEFWMSPDAFRKSSVVSLPLGGHLNLIAAGIAYWAWLEDPTGRSPKECWMPYNGGFYRMNQVKPGNWIHTALTWDKTCVRMYVDGVLMSTQIRREIKWPGTPKYLEVGKAHGDWIIKGVVDEIRLSTIRRYGPIIPKGATYAPPPFLPDASSSSDKSDKSDATGKSVLSETAPTAEQVAKARKELIGTILSTRPAEFQDKLSPEGEYIYEAATARPIVEGQACVIETDKIVKGLTVVKMDGLCGRIPDELRNGGVYWKLGKINPEKYWIGVWYQSGDSGNEAAQTASAPIQVYRNGRMVQLATHGDPVQIAPGIYFAEAFTAESVELRSDDEIALGSNNRYGTVARIILTSKEPDVGPHRIATNFGGHQWNPYTALGVNVDAIVRYPDGKEVSYGQGSGSNERRALNRASLVDADGNARVDFVFSNPLPIPVKIKCDCEVRSYYSETAAREETEMTIEPHGRVVRTLKYKWNEGEPAYLAFANLRGMDMPPYSESRKNGGLGWPEHEVYSYFQGHRHALPWPNPYAFRQLRRLAIANVDMGLRQEMELSGHQLWEKALTTELEPAIPPPANLEFKKCNVPYGERIEGIVPRPHGVYLRRTFELPEDIKGRSYRIALEYATDEATIYVNGQKTGNLRGAHTPLVCDITGVVKPGKNEIIIVNRDMIAIMDPAYVNPKSPTANISYLDAPGLFGTQSLGVGVIMLESGPAVSKEAIFIVTSVRKKTIAARITVGNSTGETKKVKVKASVLDAGKAVLTVGEKELELAPNSPVEIELENTWKDPRFWGPADPHLYAMGVEITDAVTGQRLDWSRERFGFRESWIDGPYIMFNGYPIRPIGAGRIKRLPPDGDFIFQRVSSGDWCDETGVLGASYIGGLQNSSSAHNTVRDVFWENAERNGIAKMKRLWNHPSMQAWDLSNEWLCFGFSELGAKRFKHFSDVVRAKDPSRWTFANAEGDLGGLLDNYSYHYMQPYSIYGANMGFGMNGHTAYFPDGEFWRPLSRHFTPEEVVPLCPHMSHIQLTGKKVIMNNEHLWKCGDDFMPPGPTLWVGEDDVISPAVDGSSGPIAWMWKTNLDGNRDLGVAPIQVYSYHPGIQRGAYLEQTFIIPENQRRAFSGRTETRRFTLLNGKFRTDRLVLGWKLKAPGGKTVQKGEFKHTMPSGGHERGEISFKVPNVSIPTTYTLSATLTSNGAFISREEWDIEVFPDKPVATGKLERQVLLFDPSGTTAAALKSAGVPFTVAKDAGAPSSKPESTLLIIGEGALDANNIGQTASLLDFAEDGGRVLMLQQTVAPLRLSLALEPRQWASQVFLRSPKHPVLDGLDPLSLHFWQTDRVVAKGAYNKPSAGNFMTLADSGGRLGMEWAQLLDIYRGKGLYLLCQLSVAEKYDAEPMARELLARLVRYAAGKTSFRVPDDKLELCIDNQGVKADRLRTVGVATAAYNADDAKRNPLPILADAAKLRGDDKLRSSLRQSMKDGSTLVISAVEPSDSQWLGELAGAPAIVTVPPYRIWEGRGYRNGWSIYTAGLSQLDLYWKRYDGGESAFTQAEDPSNMIEPIQYYSVGIQGGKELIFPGILVEVPLGKGKLLVDQRRWWITNETIDKLARRNICALMTALNVNIKTPIPPRTLPPALVYRTVSLAPFANLALSDDTAADGQGGWTDQGKEYDLRSFPTGMQNIQGIRFDISPPPKSAVSLASDSMPTTKNLPGEVVIPIGFAVEGLYFLQVATDSADGTPAGMYAIEYEDGEIVEISMVVGDNILDWTRPHKFTREKGTLSQIAWTGSNVKHPLLAVSRMLWVNPRPEAVLRSVRFANSEKKTSPVLFAITAAVQKGRVALNPEAEAKGKDLLAKGVDAAKSETLDDAWKLLKEALQNNPALVDGYRLLADVAERKHNEDWQLEAYRLWAESGTRISLPFNRIGEILEKRKDPKGALDAYKKSLEVEWNQPPVMDARRRLETEVK